MQKMFIVVVLLITPCLLQAQRTMEKINRGLIAVDKSETKVALSWRILNSDPAGVAFNLYRAGADGKKIKLNSNPLDGPSFFMDSTADLSVSNTWSVAAIVKGKEQTPSQYTRKGGIPTPYLTIPLKTPEGYSPNDGSVGDLDGDGEYEFIIHMAGRGRDNSQAGKTDKPILQAYKLDGTLMWTINLGKNIREGAHYTQFLVYDLDGDGKAEVACKTSNGTIDGAGIVIGDTAVDYRNDRGYILSGPEFYTVFDGLSGKALSTANYIPPRHPDTLTPTTDQLKEIWGDGYGNRVDRFLACVAYLDGKRPSLITSRGYYTRTVLSAWNFSKGKLQHVWTFDSNYGAAQNKAFSGQGNHNLSVADVDNDGKDEIIFGAMVIDDDGKGLYSTTFGHGDALHVTDLDPERPGLEVFDIQERFDDAGAHMRDAKTGENLWKKPSLKAGEDGEGPGRGNAFDIDPRYLGAECWVKGAQIRPLFSVKGEIISEVAPGPCNFASWWDGDLLREILDKNFIAKWNWNTSTLDTLLKAKECMSNNGTKGTPVLSADLFGDWREEVIWRTLDNKALHIYSTPIPTKYRFTTLMQDPVYRLGIAWQNVGYNQPPHVSFYLGEGMKYPPASQVKK
jgi:rhamnogalacturonan endolyase